jgi:predicted secreted protein
LTTREGPPSSLTLRVGEEREIELPSLGTAGYTWQHEVEDSDGAVDISWGRGPAPDAVGEAAPEVLELRGASPGRVRVRLVQRRPWERDTDPLREHEMEIVVTG